MKTLSIKLDNYILKLINEKSKEKKITRMELIRSAIINFLINQDDANDREYIEKHRNDPFISFDKAFD